MRKHYAAAPHNRTFAGTQNGEPTVLHVAGPTTCATPAHQYTPLSNTCCPAETVGGSCQGGSTMTQIVETENLLRYDPCLVMQPGMATTGIYM